MRQSSDSSGFDEEPLAECSARGFQLFGNAGTPLSFHLCSRQAIQGPPRHIGTKVNCRTMSRLEGSATLHPTAFAPLPTHVLSRRGANHAVAPKSAVAEPACRQYRVVRWFLLPEAGLRRRCFPPTTFVIVANQKCQLYPGCTPRQASCYGRCFARSVAPDAALRLARRKPGTSLPLRMQSSIPPRRLAARGCERAMRSIDGAQRNLRGGILLCIATIINNYCRKERPGNRI